MNGKIKMTQKQMKDYMSEILGNMENIKSLLYEQPWVNVDDCRKSYASGNPYSMTNQFLLWAQGGEVGEYATFYHIKKAGGRVKKGSKAKDIFFYKPQIIKVTDEKTGEEKVKEIPYYERWQVFNINTDSDLEPRHASEPLPDVVSPNKRADAILDAYMKKYGVECHRSKLCNEAYYNPATHSITLPMMKQFKDKSLFYSVKFHETVHSTGHKTILNRFKKGTTFGSDEYSREEFVAEIGAATILRMLGIETDRSLRNSATYIEGWTRAIKDDPMMVYTGINNASKAVRIIMECEA